MNYQQYIFALIFPVLFFGCGSTEGPPGGGSHPLQQEAFATAYTVRIPGHSPEEQAILLTQTVYPATREDNAVGAIIVTPQIPQLAYLAMHRVTHMPVNAPLLYLDKDNRLSEQTLREMRRLKPDGVLQDGRTQVYTLNVPETEVERIEEILGYAVREFKAPNPLEMAELLDRWQAALKANFPDEVVISAIDNGQSIEHGVGAMGWNAHMGKGFAWVYRDSVPEITKRMLDRRSDECFMYLFGNRDMISDKVAQELGRFGLVRRVAGKDPYATNAVNAGYKDYGRNYGWWWGWEPRAWGWGIAQAGHNYIIGTPEDILYLIPAAVLGHMGKHGPILLVTRYSVPKATADYLKMVKPFPTNAQATVLNYSWIIGDTNSVSLKVQQTIDRLMSPYDVQIDTANYLVEADTLQEKKQ